MKSSKWMILLLAAGMLLTACSPELLATNEPVKTSLSPTPTPAVPSAQNTPAAPVGDEMPAAVLAARNALAQKLYISLEQITLVQMEPTQWPDSCLGLGQPNEMCAQSVTPGYLISLKTPQGVYQVHTDMNGNSIRIADAPTADNNPNQTVLDSTKLKLAKQLGIDPAAIKVIQFSAVEWPNSCLGNQKPGEMCLDVMTPGYLLILEAGGEQYEFHTDQSGKVVQLIKSPIPKIGVPVINWQSTGTDCQTAQISQIGIAVGACGGNLVSGSLAGSTAVDDLQYFIRTYQAFTADTPAGKVSFGGKGIVIASPEEQRAIAEWAAQAAAEAAQGSAGSPQSIALTWHREGGIAGFCDDVIIWRSGVVFRSSCKNGQESAGSRIYLTAAQLKDLYFWLDTFQTTTQKISDNATADSMTINLSFNGSGAKVLGETDQQNMLKLVSEVYLTTTTQ